MFPDLSWLVLYHMKEGKPFDVTLFENLTCQQKNRITELHVAARSTEPTYIDMGSMSEDQDVLAYWRRHNSEAEPRPCSCRIARRN